MKVLGIFGSPRRGGNTDILLEEALKGAEEEGAEVDRLHLTDFAITPCRECHGCDQTGECVILDDMQRIYPRLLEADVIILASPIFFYGVTGWAKALIDRCQALWARKYLVKDPSLGKEGKRRKGFLIAVAATKGERVFEGAILTAKYFFDVLNAEYVGELVFRKVEKKGEILGHPEAIQQAFEAGRRLVLERREVRRMTQWKCSNCSYTFGADTVPDRCPSCNQTCTFSDVTCYIPDCGGPGNIDPRLLGKKDKPTNE